MNGQRGADKDFSKVELGEYLEGKGNLFVDSIFPGIRKKQGHVIWN